MAVSQPMRRDAARSRAAILAAARELFGSGRDVPMSEIGRRAGVGQATLYRHFPDRAAIAAAVVDEQVSRLEEIAAAHADDPRAVLVVLEAFIDSVVTTHDLVGILRAESAQAPVLVGLRARVRSVLDAALERSREARLLRADVRTEDLVLTVNMLNGALTGVTAPPERRAAATRALDIALRGLVAGDRA